MQALGDGDRRTASVGDGPNGPLGEVRQVARRDDDAVGVAPTETNGGRR